MGPQCHLKRVFLRLPGVSHFFKNSRDTVGGLPTFFGNYHGTPIYQKERSLIKITRVSMILVMVGMIFHAFSKNNVPFILMSDAGAWSSKPWCLRPRIDTWAESLDKFGAFEELNFNGKTSFLKTGEIASLSWISAALLKTSILVYSWYRHSFFG